MPFTSLNIPDNFEFGLAITCIESESYHIGFLYRQDSHLKFCHLAWHYKLKNEPFNINKQKYLCDSFKLDPRICKYLSAKVSKIGDINSKAIPYGIQPPIRSFNNENEYIGTVEGEGLTCATFIITVLETSGFSILDKNSWIHRSDDAEWQKHIIKQLKESIGLSEQYLKKAEELIGEAVRFRPHEVFACGTCNPADWPVKFESAVEAANEIVTILNF